LLIVTAIPASTNAAPNILIVVGVSPRRKYASTVAPIGSPSEKRVREMEESHRLLCHDQLT
jgi:hypothetical protein